VRDLRLFGQTATGDEDLPMPLWALALYAEVARTVVDEEQ
jgi:hypothetical protein